MTYSSSHESYPIFGPAVAYRDVTRDGRASRISGTSIPRTRSIKWSMATSPKRPVVHAHVPSMRSTRTAKSPSGIAISLEIRAAVKPSHVDGEEATVSLGGIVSLPLFADYLPGMSRTVASVFETRRASSAPLWRHG